MSAEDKSFEKQAQWVKTFGANNPRVAFHENGCASEILLLTTGGYTAVPQLLQLRLSVA